jgi:orotidine-5'-phosphate decarboxylase
MLQIIQASIAYKNTSLCVGIDPDPKNLPSFFAPTAEGIADFANCILDLTDDVAAAYKINFAFFERFGSAGYRALEQVAQRLSHKVLRIADAKRGDIGNTAQAYAASCLTELPFDAVTVNPYMGMDTVEPFLETGKGVFLLALTSNPGSADFQRLPLADGTPLYKHVLRTSMACTTNEQVGYVVGATHPHDVQEICREVQGRALLIPGVGAQGGSPEEVMSATKGTPVVVNVSRGIATHPHTSSASEWEAEVVKAAADWARRLASV